MRASEPRFAVFVSLPPLTTTAHHHAGWGFNELWLVVDEKNKPARTLYEKAGFELMGRDPRGRKVVPTEWQLREEACTNLCMRKSVAAGPESGGLGAFLSRLFGGR